MYSRGFRTKVSQMTTLVGEKSWEKTITNLSAGRYLFGTSGWRIGVVTAIMK